MFDNNVFIDGTCRNVTENGAVTGFEMQTNIPTTGASPCP